MQSSIVGSICPWKDSAHNRKLINLRGCRSGTDRDLRMKLSKYKFIAIKASKNGDKSVDDTINTLDLFLSTDNTKAADENKERSEGDSTPPAPPSQDAPVEWWAGPATNQTSPPRREGMASGDEGRFIDPTSVTQGSLTESRSGQPFPVGSNEYNIPVVPPRLTYVLLALNLAVYGVGIGIAVSQGPDASNDYFLSLAKVNDAVVAGEYWRLLSATFLHAGLLHLGLNCYALWSLGTEVESVVGYTSFAAIYMLSGLYGSGVSFLVSDAVTVGASGAIFGLLGALAAYFVKNRDIQNSGRQLLFIFLLLSINLVLGLGEDSMIDNSGHIGGFVVGCWLGWGMGPKYIVTNEVDVPEGSITVPDDAKEVSVVIDQTTDFQRWIVAVSCLATLPVVVWAGVVGRTQFL